MDEPVKAGFFFRPQQGEELLRRALQVFDASLTAPVPVDSAGETPAVYAEPPAELMTPPGVRAGRMRWPVFVLPFAALALAALVALLFLDNGNQQPPPPPPSVALRIVRQSGQLQVAWNAQALPIQQARQATLEIEDGVRSVSLPLDPAILRLGYWMVPRTSTDVTVRLAVDSPVTPDRLVEVARFVGQPDGAPSKSSDADLALLALRQETAKLQSDLQDVAARNTRLENALVAARRNATPAAATPAPQPPAAAPAQPAAAPPPVVAQAPAPVSEAPPATPTAPAASPPALPAPEPVSRPPAYTGPRAGKLIWTGVLPPGGVLTIDGRRASSGTFSGALPGVNVRVVAYPAELSAGGLSVLSGAAQHARGDVTEPRSAQNGWLNTTYRYDPARAQDVVVAEGPGAANSFRKIVVRGGSRSVSAVVIAWEVVE